MVTGTRLLVAASAIFGLFCSAFALSQARAEGPSFDCSSASHADEQAICASEELSALDRAMAFKFKYALTIRDASQVRDQGRAFLRKRRNCSGDGQCIKDVMSEAIRTYSEDPSSRVETKSVVTQSVPDNDSDATAACRNNNDTPVDIVLAACTALLGKNQGRVAALTEIRLIRATTYYYNNQPNLCIDEVNAALSINPQSADALSDRGMCYYALGDYDHAIDDFTNVINTNPTFILALDGRGLAYDAKENYPLAIADYTARLHIGTDANTLSNRGAAYNFSGLYVLAIDDLKTAIGLDPQSAPFHRHYGVAYGELNNYDSAIEELTTAINLDPDYSLAYADRGAAYFNKGNYDGALADFNQALNLNPKNIDVLIYRGLTYFILGDDKKAIVDLSLAIAVRPNSAEAFNARGQVFLDLKGYGAAIEDLRESARLNPQYVDSHFRLGAAYLAQNNTSAAIDEFKTVIQLEPANSAFSNEAHSALDALAKRGMVDLLLQRPPVITLENKKSLTTRDRIRLSLLLK